MYILKILLILLLIVLPFGELAKFHLEANVNLKILDIITGLISLWLIILAIQKKIKIQFHWYLVFFPIVGFISLVINSSWLTLSSFSISFFYLLRWISYLGAFYAVIAVPTSFQRKIVLFLIFDGILVVLLGFLQYFFFSSSIPLISLGWDDHMYRLFSVFIDPNFAGGFICLYIIFIAGVLVRLFNNKVGNNFLHIRFLSLSLTWQRIFMSLFVIVSILALLLTFSRSSLLMFITSFIVFLVLIGKKKIILFLFICLGIYIFAISSNFYIENINLFRTASSTSRLDNYSSAIKVITNKPILGVGFNSYRYAKDLYNIQYGWVNRPSHADAGVDNSILFVLATTGIIGLIAYLYLWLRIMLHAHSLYSKNKNVQAAVVIASIAGIFVHSLFLNSLFFPEILVWLWIQIGLMSSKN